MTAMMIDDGKRVAAGGARLQWHIIPIADIDLIARNTRGDEMGSQSSSNSACRFVSQISQARLGGVNRFLRHSTQTAR